MSAALVLRGVYKSYGKTAALTGLDLEVPKGSVFGFVGPNGAGKTTTFGIVSGAIRCDRGEVDVLGSGPFDPSLHAGRVSVLPQDCALNPFSSARQLLRFYARLQGMSRKEAIADAERVLDLVRLRDRGDSRVGQLSHGMRRRLAVAQAFLGDPALVLLDEPTGGLDPHLVAEMRDVLRDNAGERTLVVSTHILSDIESTCDQVAFLEGGRCIESGPIAQITRQRGIVRIRLGQPIELADLGDLLDGRDPRIEDDELVYDLADDEDVGETQRVLLSALLERGVEILEVRLGESLEAAYLKTRASDTSSATQRAQEGFGRGLAS